MLEATTVDGDTCLTLVDPNSAHGPTRLLRVEGSCRRRCFEGRRRGRVRSASGRRQLPPQIAAATQVKAAGPPVSPTAVQHVEDRLALSHPAAAIASYTPPAGLP